MALESKPDTQLVVSVLNVVRGPKPKVVVFPAKITSQSVRVSTPSQTQAEVVVHDS